MTRARIPSSFFVFVIVEHEGHVLLVRERKHGQRWYAPAGGLEQGETIWEAAIRETMEEAGVAIEPTSLLRVEQQWYPAEHQGGALTSWWRFVMRARPTVCTPEALTPKWMADEHSLEARWVRPEQIEAFPLRHHEVVELVALALLPDGGHPLFASRRDPILVRQCGP